MSGGWTIKMKAEAGVIVYGGKHPVMNTSSWLICTIGMSTMLVPTWVFCNANYEAINSGSVIKSCWSSYEDL